MTDKAYRNLLIAIGIIALIQIMFLPIRLVIGSGNSMKPTFEGTTPLICYKTNNYEIGDIVLYQIDGLKVVHRIIEVHDNGVIKSYQMKGDGNPEQDYFRVFKENIKCKIKV